jgi:hypothetical protein
MGPVVIASEPRVALGDEIGALLRGRIVAVLIGARPGLSSPESAGLYLTFAPQIGRSDAERNCISNVRPGGLGVDEAAGRLAWLVDQHRCSRPRRPHGRTFRRSHAAVRMECGELRGGAAYSALWARWPSWAEEIRHGEGGAPGCHPARAIHGPKAASSGAA